MEEFNPATSAYKDRSIHDLLSLKGKTAVVTGGARGLGLSWARGCAEAEADVAVIDLLDEPEEGFALFEEECGVKAKFYRADVTNYAQMEETIETIVVDFGSIDCLVAGAGIGVGGSITDISPDDIQRVIGVNTIGTIYTCQLCVRQMTKQNRPGSIVTVASTGAHGGIMGQTNSAYCASKGAVLAFTKSLAVELAQKNIRVNSISPGFFLTNMTPGYTAGNLELLEWFAKHGSPMGRFADRAEAKTIVPFLLSDASIYCTGGDYPVDGGVLALS